MQTELKIKWLEALRSGKYGQIKENLRSLDETENVGYCCLGVLCDISGIGSWSGQEFIATLPEPYFDEESCDCEDCGGNVAIIEDTSFAELNSGTLKAFGLSHSDAETLMGMNDTDGKSFSEIADWIEENV